MGSAKGVTEKIQRRRQQEEAARGGSKRSKQQELARRGGRHVPQAQPAAGYPARSASGVGQWRKQQEEEAGGLARTIWSLPGGIACLPLHGIQCNTYTVSVYTASCGGALIHLLGPPLLCHPTS